MSLLIILLLFSFQGTLERFTPSKLNNNYYMFVIHKHNVPSCLAPVTQRLAVFMFPPTISQHCPYGLFPLSRRIHSKLYVVKRVTYAFQLSLERRRSSRTFRYGYLVTTSPQSLVPPSAAGS